MKQLVLLALAFISFSCTKAQKTQFTNESLSEKLVALNDKQIDFKEILKKHRGKTVVLEIWASWCSDCIKAMPKLKELQLKHPEVDYVFISMDKTTDKWKAGIEKHELKGDHYLALDGMKGAFGKSIDLDWIPRYLILDKKGKIVTYRAIETDFEQIDQTLNSLQ